MYVKSRMSYGTWKKGLMSICVTNGYVDWRILVLFVTIYLKMICRFKGNFLSFNIKRHLVFMIKSKEWRKRVIKKVRIPFKKLETRKKTNPSTKLIIYVATSTLWEQVDFWLARCSSKSEVLINAEAPEKQVHLLPNIPGIFYK